MPNSTTLEKGARFVWENARLLERDVFAYRFSGAAPARILATLRAYRNADGGMGHALEPDLRAPDSQPLFVEFALRTLYECGLRDPDLAQAACGFLARHADLHQGIPTLLPSAAQYPHAAHWDNPASMQPSFDRLTGLVGLARWQGIHHPWLDQAVEVCLAHVAATRYTDAHTIGNAFCLLESLAPEQDTESLFDKLAAELLDARFFLPSAPVEVYGLTPLTFAPTPGAYCRRIFSESQIAAHLDDLASHQGDDGGWPIQWEPPGAMARCEWRAHKTVSSLSILRAYGRI